MFDEIPYGTRFRLPVFLLHLLVAPPLLFVFSFIIGDSLMGEFWAESLGFPIGALFATLMPEYAKEALWIPVVPVLLFFIGEMHDLLQRPFHEAMLNFVDRDILGLLTIPIWGCCCYAAGIAVILRGAKQAER